LARQPIGDCPRWNGQENRKTLSEPSDSFEHMDEQRTARLSESLRPDVYAELLADIKQEVKTARLRAAVVVNTEMVALYWRIGHLILKRQRDEGWGARVIDRLSVDLRAAYPQVKGFSRSNLHYMRAFALAWPEIVQQAVGQIPWGHITLLLGRLENRQSQDFYARRVVDEGWSRNVLLHHVRHRLHERVGTAPNTFNRTVPPEEQEAVHELVRDPYVLDFVDGSEVPKERDLEQKLITHIAHFLQELGAGFAFMGRQHCLLVGGEEFFVDLLFYHVGLRRYVVIELKVGKFMPEHAGKLAFYVNVVDRQLRKPEHDDPTIGILLVAGRNDVVVEFALETVGSPVAVSTWSALPTEVRSMLPSAEELSATVTSALDSDSQSAD